MTINNGSLAATSIDWAWVAGIFEGEGCAGLRWAKKRHEGSARRCYLYVSIAQKETSMLIEVQRIVGFGKIYPANRRDGGVLFSWQCACANARIFLMTLLPYIRSHHKRKQVEDALSGDAEMRVAGAEARRACLARCSAARWAAYRAAKAQANA